MTPEAWEAYTRHGVTHPPPGWAEVAVVEEDVPTRSITRLQRSLLPIGMVARRSVAP